MLKLFQFEHGSICSTRRVVISGQFKYAFDRLVTPPFDQGPLGKMDPPPACPTPLRYLSFLALRVDRAMTGSGVNPEMIGWPQKPIPTKEEVQAIKDTWRDLSRISIFHTGGWYMSKTLSQDAACRVLDAMTQLSTGIYHDLDISRILVKFKADEKLELIIPTGWEHAFHAPKWSAARMPWWLVPGYYDPRNLPITSEEKREMSRVIYKYMGQQDRKWVICYAYGQAERFFEGLLKTHWMCRDAVEAGIKVLEARWMDIHPIIPPFTLGSSQMRTSSIPNQCRQDQQQLQIHRKTDHGTDKDKVSVKGSAKR